MFEFFFLVSLVINVRRLSWPALANLFWRTACIVVLMLIWFDLRTAFTYLNLNTTLYFPQTTCGT